MVVLGITVGYVAAKLPTGRREKEPGSRSEEATPAPRYVAGSTSLGTSEGKSNRVSIFPNTSMADPTLRAAGITKEDIDETLRIQKEQENGVFTLKDETPFNRKMRQFRYKALAHQAASDKAIENSQTFAALQIPPETSDELQNHLEKIHRASLEAEEAIAQLLDARQRYDERMRSLLPDAEYNRYRSIESRKPAEQEWRLFVDYALNQKGFAIPPEYERPLTDAIAAAGAAETGDWHGPYDDLPDVRMGHDEILAYVQERLNQTENARKRVTDQVSDSDMPNEIKSLLAEYYSAKLLNKKELFTKINSPEMQSAAP